MKIDDRMKFYEGFYAKERLIPLLPTFARIDGRSFHTFTKGLKRPFDENLNKLMIETTNYLVEETQPILAFTQSDEITLMWTTNNFSSQIFFNHRIAKMTSILAAMTSVFFNKYIPAYLPTKKDKMPVFDTRVWSVPNEAEAVNTFLWREQDAITNSISMLAQHYFSHNELQHKSVKTMKEMLLSKGIDWETYPAYFKHGTYIQRKKVTGSFSKEQLENLPEKHIARNNPDATFERTEINKLNVCLSNMTNRKDFVFRGKEPINKG